MDDDLFGPASFRDESLRYKFAHAATDDFRLSDSDKTTRDRWRAKARETLDRYDANHHSTAPQRKDDKTKELWDAYQKYRNSPPPPGGHVTKTLGQIRREAESFIDQPYHKARTKFIKNVRARDVRHTRKIEGIPEKQPDRTGEEYRLELNRR